MYHFFTYLTNIKKCILFFYFWIKHPRNSRIDKLKSYKAEQIQIKILGCVTYRSVGGIYNNRVNIEVFATIVNDWKPLNYCRKEFYCRYSGSLDPPMELDLGTQQNLR